MAAVINKRDSELQAASPRVTTVNLPSSLNVTTVGGQPALQVITNAQNAAAHAASTGNPHGADLDSINDGVTYFRSNANQNTGAGRAFNALNSSSEYIRSLKSTQMTVVGLNPSTGWVGDSNGIRMYQSGVQKINIPVSGDPIFQGNITGGSNINVTGQGVFSGGSTLFGYQAAVHANGNKNALQGIVAFSGAAGAAIRGLGETSGYGVIGKTSDGSRAGVVAEHNAGGTALEVNGKMEITSSTLVSNLNADRIDSLHASSLCQESATNSGTSTVAAGALNIQVTGSLAATVRTRAIGNLISIENISDARLKQDIEDETLGLDFINQLRPRSFRMRADPKLKCHGFIYQETSTLIKNDDSLANLNSDGQTGAVHYDGLTSPIVKAIQELYQQLQEVKNGQKARSIG